MAGNASEFRAPKLNSAHVQTGSVVRPRILESGRSQARAGAAPWVGFNLSTILALDFSFTINITDFCITNEITYFARACCGDDECFILTDPN